MGREPHSRGEQVVTPADAQLARLAQLQHGVVGTSQLRAAGLERSAIHWRLRNGRLHPLHRGVYAVGHTRLTVRGRLWAAVLACGGSGAVALSHRSAASLWDLLPPPRGPVDVTTLRRSASTAAIRVHRSRTLDPARDVVEREGLPVTTPMRTLLDLGDVLSPHRLERVCHRAELLRLLDVRALEPLPAGRRTRALRAALRSLAAADPQLTRSELEERFLALVAAHGLPRPRVNARLHGLEADFLWPQARLVVETDGAAAHLTARAFERDRERDQALTLAGYAVLRFTARQVLRTPDLVAATLRGTLSRRDPGA